MFSALVQLALVASLIAGCGSNSPLNFTKPSETHRGEADAINPARHVTVICGEKDKNQSSVTTNITNNCDKSTQAVFAPEAE